MKLLKLTLLNIGPYVGKNVFKLDSEQPINTTLVGGRNGTGKTTFLESLRLALYGPLAFGFKTASKTYLEQVKSILNNEEKEQQSPKFQIVLDVILTEDWQEKEYTLVRTWKMKENEVSEYIEVYNDRYSLSPVEMENFFSILYSHFPPSLFELCLFDGENIIHLNDKNLANYLKELSLNLFNLEIFNELEEELNEYIQQTVDSEQEEKFLLDLEKLNKEIAHFKAEIESMKKSKQKNLDLVEELKEINENLKLSFKLHGGLMREERDKLRDKISELENKRKYNIAQIKVFLAEKLPFYLARKPLKQLGIQLELEEKYHLSNVLQEKIEDLPINEIISAVNLNTNEKQIVQIKKSLLGYLVDDINIDLIHNLSNAESQDILNLISKVTKSNLKNVIDLLEQNRKDLKELQKLRARLRDNEESSEFNDLLKELEHNNQLINDYDKKINLLDIELKEKVTKVNDLESKRRKLSSSLNRLRRKRKSFREADKAIRTTRKYIDVQMKRKLKDIEYFAISMVKKVMRKDNFITRITIDPKTFKINIYGQNQKPIDLKILSAGESQMFILCIIWGALAASKKRVPFVFDTLFGRLDYPHRLAVIEQLIPEFGDQVIVLATDTELTKDLYVKLKSSISNEYVLEYMNDVKQTKIHEDVFFTSEEVMPF